MPIARKRFGQNFLIDTQRLEKALAFVNPKSEDIIIEIGPGTGALTRLLLPTKAQIWALEIDRDLISGLKVEFFNYKNFNLIEADALKLDFTQLLDKPKRVRIIGNLPYNIATNLIFKFWHLKNVADMHFMLQTEVALRLTAKKGDSNYGRLSVLSQYFCTAEIIMDFPPSSFSPAPKVNSSFVRLVPKLEVLEDFTIAEALSNTLRIAFAQRRKTLANNFKNFISADKLSKLNIDAKLRPQNLTLEEFLIINDYLIKTNFAQQHNKKLKN